MQQPFTALDNDGRMAAAQTYFETLADNWRTSKDLVKLAKEALHQKCAKRKQRRDRVSLMLSILVSNTHLTPSQRFVEVLRGAVLVQHKFVEMYGAENVRGLVADALDKAWLSSEVSGPGDDADPVLKDVWEKRKQAQGVGSVGKSWGRCRNQ